MADNTKLSTIDDDMQGLDDIMMELELEGSTTTKDSAGDKSPVDTPAPVAPEANADHVPNVLKQEHQAPVPREESTSTMVQGQAGDFSDAGVGGGSPPPVLPESVGTFARELGFGNEAESLSSALGSFWKSAKLSAASVSQKAQERAASLQSKMGVLVHEASDQLLTAGDQLLVTGEKAFSNAGAAARNLNTKILIRPEASFGVPIEAILKRECGDDQAERVPLTVETLLGILEDHAKTNGPLPITYFTHLPASHEKEALHALRDDIDLGAPITAIPAERAAQLLKIFLVDLPGPLIPGPLYADFLSASVAEGAVAKCSDVAERIPPPSRATARRILSCLNAVVEASSSDALQVAIGPTLLRSGNDTLHHVMMDIVPVVRATRVLLEGADRIFVPTCWFMGPWMGVFSLKCVEGPGSREEEELLIDADGMTWGGCRSRLGSEVDASGWARHADRDEAGMVAAAKFDSKTLVLCFKGDSAAAGLSEVEEVVIEAVGELGELTERVTRRFAGKYVRPLPWQETLEAWAKDHVGRVFDEEVHPAKLKELWELALPGREVPPRKHESWNELGFQQKDPATDFRGSGMLALDMLLVLAKTGDLQGNLERSKGQTAMEGYPFACGCINVCFMLMEVLQLFKGAAGSVANVKGGAKSAMMKESGSCRRVVGTMMLTEGDAFERIFVAAVKVLDEEWAVSTRSYMQFNEVMAKVRARCCAAIRAEGVHDVQGICNVLLRK